MFATLTISGSGAASTQTACGRRARTMRSATIRCSRRSLSLRSSCSPRWSSTAGSELRRVEPARATVETLAPARRTSSSGLAPMKAASGVPQQKQKQAGNCSRIAPKTAAGSWAAAALTITSRASTTLESSPTAIRDVAPSTAASNSRGGRALRISECAVGCGSSSGSGASRRRLATREASSSASRSTPSPGPATALTVRKARSPRRQIETCGSTSEAGASEDQVEVAPPSGSKAKPPSQTGPAPAGRLRGSSDTGWSPSRRHSSATSRKRRGPRELASCATPKPARANSRSGCSQQNQRSLARREAKTIAHGSSTSTSLVTLTRVRRPRSAPFSKAPRRSLVVTTAYRDLSRADDFDQAVRTNHPLEGLDLVGGAGHLDRHRPPRHVNDFGPEDLGELDDLGPVLDRRGDLEQGHLPGDRLFRLHVADLQHVDELVQLLGHLIDRVDGAVEGEGDPRDRRVIGRADGERVDVEAAAGEEPGDARQHARLVLDLDREYVLAAAELAGDVQILEFDHLWSAGLHQLTT